MVELVQLQVQDGVARLRLQDSRRMNPLTEPLLRELLQALVAVQQDSSLRVLVVEAEGKGFCVGADLQDMGQALADPASREALGAQTRELLLQWGAPVLELLRSLPVVTVSAVQGPVAGGGVGLALATDLVIAAESAYFYLPFVPALGLIPDMGATWFMHQAIGPARTLGLSLLGDRLPARQAQDWGLIWSCVPDAQLNEQLEQTVARLAALPAHAIAAAKASLIRSGSMTLKSQLAWEADMQGQLINRPEFAEGVAAFLARRAPVFHPPGETHDD